MLEEHIGGCYALAVELWEKVNDGVEKGLVDRNIPFFLCFKHTCHQHNLN